MMLEIEVARSFGEVVVVDFRITALKNWDSDGYIQLPVNLSLPVSCSLLDGIVAVWVGCARGIVLISRSCESSLLIPVGRTGASVAD